MHRFTRMHLSAADAMQKLDAIDLEEKNRIAEGIALIAVIDHRKDYLGAGYACMRDYCMGRLHMSEDRAFRRIQVARAALQFPEVFEFLADGRLGVTTAAELAPHLDSESASELIAAAAFKSKEEIRRLMAERAQPRDLATSPAELALASDVESVSGSLAPAQVNSLVGNFAPPAEDTQGPAATAQVSLSRRGRIFSSASGGHKVRLSITEEEHADLRQAQSLLGHAVPSGDPAVIYARAMTHYLAHLEKRRLGAKPASATALPRCIGRGIPKPLQRFVWERDGGKCAFVSANGHRCEATRRLEIDHIQPIALGGETKPENLRLLCRPHNQFEAERVLGKDHVAKKREFAQRERARDKAAARSSAARAQARGAATKHSTKPTGPPPHPHHDDILAALSSLGFNKAEAGRGADLAKAQPEASLEACVRLALTTLTRQVVARGARLARCSA